jgi:hypothetical protein
MKRAIRAMTSIRKWRDMTMKWHSSRTGPCTVFKNALLLFSVPLTDVALSPEAVCLHSYECTQPTQFTKRKWRTAVDWRTAAWNVVLFCYRQDIIAAVRKHKAVEVRRISETSIVDLHESFDTTTHIRLMEPAVKNVTLCEYQTYSLESEGD